MTLPEFKVVWERAQPATVQGELTVSVLTVSCFTMSPAARHDSKLLYIGRIEPVVPKGVDR